MPNIATAQRQTNFSTEFHKIEEPKTSQSSATARNESASKTTQLGADEHVAKTAGRLNASAVSVEEREALLVERKSLVDKEIAGTLTRPERIRLEYVRWSLDRIEDAVHGPAMDRLEEQIEEFRRLASRLGGVQQSLERLSPNRQSSHHRRR